MTCGSTNTAGAGKYNSHANFSLCIVFEQFDPTQSNLGLASRKTVYPMHIDKFSALELHGIYDMFKDRQNLTVYALSNGVRSRPTNIKYNGGVAEILNLVIKLKGGAIEAMDWKNDCI